MENLTLPSSILFRINMEGSKRTSTRIGDLSSLIFNKKQAQKKQQQKTPL